LKAKRFATFGLLALVAVTSGALLAQAPQAVGTWASVGDVGSPLSNGAVVTLSDGRTLIAGGIASGDTPTDAVTIYNPVDNSVTAAGVLVSARSGHTATLLKDGRVLVVGGVTDGGLISTDIEVFDPASGTSALVAFLAEPRRGHVAASLPDGTVLIAGGVTTDGLVLQTAAIFDPDTNTVSPLSTAMQTARVNASATPLLDGRVLVAGGSSGSADLKSAEIYDRYSRSFAMAATQMSVVRQGHSAVLLPNNGSVLIVGGTSNGIAQAGADLFLPAVFPDPFSYGEGEFASTGAMTAARSAAIAGPTSIEGYAFAAGGGAPDAEVYRFATIKTDKDDYAPGELAVITGAGWQPGEEVTLLFQEDPAVHDDYVLKVTANNAGNIYWNQWAPDQHDFGVRFYLMATGSQSRAQTTFTDGKLFTSVISPTSAAAGVATAYTLTVTNTSAGSPIGNIGCVQITIPTGVTNIVSLSRTATDPGAVDLSSGWSAATVFSGTTIDTHRTAGGNGQGAFDIDPTGTIVIHFTATSTGGSKVWTTSASGNQNCGDPFAISGGQPSVTVTGAKSTPTISFAAAPTPMFGGGDFAVSATTTNTDSSALTYSVVSGPCALVSGSTFSSSGAGACVVQASGPETANFNAASNTQSVTIAKATSTTTTVGAGPFMYDGTTHSGGSGTVTGAGTITGSATVTYTGDQINVGTYFVTAHYAGDANHEASDGEPVGIEITKAPSTTTTVGAGPFVYTGSVQTGGSGTVTGAGTITGSATVTYTGDQVNAGTYYVTAHYAGDANHDPSDGAAVAIVITKADATIVVTPYSVIYDGKPHTATGSAKGVNNVDLSALLNLTGTTHTDAGTYSTDPWTFAGNTNYKSVSGGVVADRITYDWQGFLQPINDTAHQIGATQSKFKLGQTVPVKFIIRDAAGVAVQQTTNPTFRMSNNLGACSSYATLETTDQSAPDVVPVFKWDGTQYHFNWSTKGLTGGVYRIYAQIGDGTQPWVDVCLTK
jgi:Galactose oxidase, central domain